MKKGFTLIELLVVVLIIGILAAVALPKYKKAVEKTRIITYISKVQDIVRAEQVYYLANGEYTSDLNNLDIDLTKICNTVGGSCYNELYNCPEKFGINVHSARCKVANSNTIDLKYCPNSSEICFSGTSDYALKVSFSIDTGEKIGCTGELCNILQ